MYHHSAERFSHTELLEQANGLVAGDDSISSVSVITPEHLLPYEASLARHMAEISHVDLLIDANIIRVSRPACPVAQSDLARQAFALVRAHLPHSGLGFPNVHEGTR